MKKCKSCGKWWREDDRRMLWPKMAVVADFSAKICKASGRNVSFCCTSHPGDRCYKCNKDGGRA